MKNKASNLRQRSKKTYTKPELKQIPLRPEEAVLGFCKVEGSYGPTLTNCILIGLGCQTIGS